MSKKGGNFFEQHIEKIVLVIVGLVCIWLLAGRVLVSPNKVEYNGRKIGPDKIDECIGDQAEDLKKRLNGEPKLKPAYKPKKNAFLELLDGSRLDGNKLYADLYPLIAELFPSSAEYAVCNIDISVDFDLPPNTSKEIIDDREYGLPLIGKVTDAAVGHIRAVAYLPVAAIDEENAYDEGGSEPNDIDFVTVEAKFDVAKLYESFYGSFAGEDVREEWRDPCLASPVFAVVQLQRRQLLTDDSWGDWQNVPRTTVDHRKEMFESVEGVEDVSLSGVKMRLFQFDEWQVRRDLLQPDAYRIASAEEEWFPPLLHKKYLDLEKKREAQERREEAEKKEEEREQERERDGRGRAPYTERGRTPYTERGRAPYTERGRTPYTERGRAPYTERERGRGGPVGRDDRRKSELLRSARIKKTSKLTPADAINDLYDELDKILITRQTELAKMQQPLLFWAHDDTVEPGETYRYRVRLGVFNPIAGTDWVREQDEGTKNDVILWSEFSKETGTVEIPRRLYFFPLKTRGNAKTVDVKVARYVWGYWYGWTFPVQQGEVIGRVRENKQVKDETEEDKEDITVPETIDYGTGAVLVDVTTVNDWAGGGGKSLHHRVYSDMLYSFDGGTIEHMPVKQNCWPKELQSRYSEISRLEKKQRKPWRDWRSRLDTSSRRVPRRTDEEFERGEGSREAREQEIFERMKRRERERR